ncbi:MAG: ATP-binding cassette domain-containing protein [Candidatus Solibacter usitatus]|nr:ATP-binding cassette domain-containing protein [Candidatus Solibacter usitatus]
MSGEPHPSILSFDDVTFGFEDEPVLRNVTFSLHRGETLIVHGAAGSGKTVLLKIALGLLRPSRGTVRVFGRDVTALHERDWFDVRSHIGVLFQEGGLFDSLSIEDNVAYPLLNQPRLAAPQAEVDLRVRRSLEFVELGHTLDKLPSELSGGMRRRVGIARAIVTEPELMLYDSPTAGLDPITANTIMALILKGRDVRRASTMIVTHRHQDGEILERYRYDEASAALRPAGTNGSPSFTRYMVLDQGRIAFIGSPVEFDSCADPLVARFASR